MWYKFAFNPDVVPSMDTISSRTDPNTETILSCGYSQSLFKPNLVFKTRTVSGGSKIFEDYHRHILQRLSSPPTPTSATPTEHAHLSKNRSMITLALPKEGGEEEEEGAGPRRRRSWNEKYVDKEQR